MPRFARTLYEYFALYSSLTLLGIICLTWSVFALPLYFILPERLGTSIGRRGIMLGFRLYAWSLSITGTYHLDLRAVDSLKGGPPLILAPNHPCLIDALLILTRHPNLVCVMKSELMRNVFLGSGSRLARYVPNDSSRQMVKESVAHLRRGGVLLLFPEGTRTIHSPINSLVGSVGLIDLMFWNRSADSDDLNAHAFRILDVEARVEIVFRSYAELLQLPGHRFAIELLDADREMVHQAGRALVVKRNQGLRHAEAHDFVGFILADYRESENLFIKGDRPRQIGDLNAHVVDPRPFDDGALLGQGGRRGGRRGQHGETLHQLTAREPALLESAHQI